MSVRAGIAAIFVISAIACLAYFWLAGEDLAHKNQGTPLKAAKAPTPALGSRIISATQPAKTTQTEVERSEVQQELTQGIVDRLESINGVVLDAQRQPMGSVHVSIAGKTAETEISGEFRFEGTVEELSGPLIAVANGLEPTLIETALQRARQFAPGRLEIVLVGQSLSIAGRLLDVSGKPCLGWHLELESGTDSGLRTLPALSAEDLSAGALSVPASVQGPAAVMNPNSQVVGKDGKFVVRGLRRGARYVLRAWNQSTLEEAVSPPVVAGTEGYIFVVQAPSLRPRVGGVVHDRWGVPLEGVRVRLTMRVHSSKEGSTFQTGQEIKTAADGRFVFVDVPRRPLLIRFTGDKIRSLYREFPGDESGLGLDVQLERQVSFRLLLRANHAAVDSLQILDGTGETMRMTLRTSEGVSRGLKSAPVKDGSSGRLTASDRAAQMLLFREGKLVSKFPIRILPGDVQAIRH